MHCMNNVQFFFVSVSLDKPWLDKQFHDAEQTSIKKPDELIADIKDPNGRIDERLYDRILGSIFGLILGDALGAHVEFRPRDFLVANPVSDLHGGGTWGLAKGQVIFSYYIKLN